jgi:hypothetical protein
MPISQCSHWNWNFLKVELELLEFTLELELFKKPQFHTSVPLFSLLQKFKNLSITECEKLKSDLSNHHL